MVLPMLRGIACGLMFAAAPVFAGSSNADVDLSIGDRLIRYSVVIKGFKVGKIETRIREQDDHFTVESVTKPGGLAALLLGGNVTDRCEFSMAAGQGVVGQHYRSYKKGKSGFDRQLSYDWATRQIQYGGGESEAIPEGILLDNCNFYAAIALSDNRQMQEQKIHVLDAKESRYRGYQFVSQQHEQLKTRFGVLETTKLTFARDNNSERQLIFWLSGQFRLSPVKIVERRKGRRTELKLISYK